MSKSYYYKTLKDILKRYNNNPKWIDSRFAEIKLISNTHVGSVGQDFIEELCKLHELEYSFPLDDSGKKLAQNPWDIEICGLTFELKTASEDIKGKFQFNHIRYHRPYNALLCLGISPDHIFFDVWSKADVVTGKAGKLVTMEKGANASYKLTKARDQLIGIIEFQNVMLDFLKCNASV